MKKLLSLLVFLCMLIGIAAAFAEETTVTLTLNPNHDGGNEIILSATAPVTRVTKQARRYGYNFAGWFHDAECTRPVSEQAPVTEDATLYANWTIWSEDEKAKYDNFLSEMTLGHDLSSRPHAYTEESFKPYHLMYTTIVTERTDLNYILSITSDEMQAQINELRELREQLVLIGEEDEGTLYIWGEEMAQSPNAEDYDYYLAYINEDFCPFLSPFYAEDKANAKGNIIVIAGGGYTLRSNLFEGYNVAEFFQSQGYNAFVLQRRVEPFTPDDAQLDLQRSIRYLRYNAEKLGIGGTDKIAAIGFSGGSRTIISAVNKYYGDVQPTVLYPDYTPDEVDAVNSDLQAMLLIYGAEALDTENPNIPPCFMVVGQEDDYGHEDPSAELFLALNQRGVSTELHIFADCAHGFGLADGYGNPLQKTGSINGAQEWPELAITFLDVKLGYLPRINEVGK